MAEKVSNSIEGDASEIPKPVELGFIECAESNECLKSYRFPSKVGGCPAWLALKNIPSVEKLACVSCGKPRVLLLQIYSPDNADDNSFHRTLFVFVCREAECNKTDSSSNFLVLRSQLPKVNKFYSDRPPVVQSPSGKWVEVEDSSFPKVNVSDYSKLCFVCGGRGPKTCSKCRAASYCSKYHQTTHWKSGHKKECTEELKSVEYVDFSKILFNEYSLVTETEIVDSESDSDADEEQNESETESKMGKSQGQSGKGLKTAELEKMALTETQEDKIFHKFKQRIQKDPEQVLRYQRGGQPLWVSGQNVPSKDDILACSCGGQRQFEFQVLPQLLNHLGVDSLGASLDWGTVAVYTCQKNCHINDNYVEEFVWKQDFKEENK